MNQISKLLLIFFVAVIFYQVNFAQSDDAWAIEQQCLPEPSTTLPDDWSFDGTLILTSSNKLHAYRQEWDTPHILLFSASWNIPHSGQLSPDGKWFAIVKGDSKRIQAVTLWTTDEIQVIDTNNGTQFIVEWDTWFGATHTLYGRFLEWLPDNKLLYSRTESDSPNVEGEEWYVIDPFTADVTEWESNINPHQDSFYLAPDAQKAVYGDYGWDFFLHNEYEEIQLPIWQATWNPNSTKFATFIVDENFQTLQFVTYNINGNMDAVILNNLSGDWSRLLKNAWSHDGRYLIFEADKIYIADTESQILIDPCINARSMTVAWSQDDSQLAFVDEYDRQRRIQIIDFDLWERFVVGYHSGKVIGWRAGDE